MARIYISHANWGLYEIGGALVGGMLTATQQSLFREELRRKISDLAGRDAHVVDSGRGALRMALEVLAERYPRRREVIMPAYICSAVPMTVASLGLVPRYVDVGMDLNATAQAIKERMSGATLAVVLAHMYGCPADVPNVETLCRDRGIALIDDAAQVIGETVDGRMLGTFGDFGILSFAQSKSVVCGMSGSGGVVLVNNAAFREALEKRIRHLPAARGSLWSKLSFASTLTGERLGPDAVYYWARFRGLMQRSSREPRSEQLALISGIDTAIARAQLKRLNGIRVARQRITDLYGDSTDRLSGCTFPQYSRGRFLSRILLMSPEGVSAAEIRKRLRRKGFGSRPGYPIYGEAGAAPWAQMLRDRLFEAPSFPGMRQRDVDEFCDVLALVLAEREGSPMTPEALRNREAES